MSESMQGRVQLMPPNAMPGFRKTKVGWIPEGWVHSVIGEATHYLTSGSRGWSQYYNNTGELFVRITNLTREAIRLDYADCCFVKLPSGTSEGTRTRLKAGDILISITADLGIIAYFSSEEPYPLAYVNQHVALLRLYDKNISSKFVAYQLAAPHAQRRFQEITDQGAKAGLNLASIRSFPVVLPSLPEQEAIAGVLECWDKAIRGGERKIEKKRQVKKGLMQQLLSGQRRLPGFKGKWGEVKLGDIAAPIKTVVGEKVVTPMSLSAGIGFVPQETKFGKDISGAQYQRYTLLTKGCFAYNKGNSKKYPQGCIYLLEEHDEVAVPNVFVCFKLDPSAAVDEYFRQVFLANMHGPALVRFINSGVRNNGLLNLTASNFFQIKLPLPPLPEQRAIAAVLSAADAEIAALERKLGALREQKRFLLNNLVTGAIRLPAFCRRRTHRKERK